MAAGEITISYGAHTVSFRRFIGEEAPQTRQGQVSLEFSSLGVAYTQGPPRAQRRVWAISAVVTAAEAATLDALAAAWDAARATGAYGVTVSLVDGIQGDGVTGVAVAITGWPSFGRFSVQDRSVAITLSEV